MESWGRVGFDGGDGDTHGDDNDNGDDDGHAHDDDDVDGDLVRRYVMVVSVVMNHAWSEESRHSRFSGKSPGIHRSARAAGKTRRTGA
jgi:hypothetical protein